MYKIIRKTILLTGLIIILLSIFVNIPIWLFSKDKISYEIENLPTMDAGLLLGTSKYLSDGGRNEFFYYRVQAAYELLDSGVINKIILSGSKDYSYDEVEWMKEELMLLGVAEENMLYDKKGERTQVSVANALDLGYEKFIVISQKFHVERALFLGALKDLQLYGYAAESPDTIYSSKVYTRELLARIKLLFVDILFY